MNVPHLVFDRGAFQRVEITRMKEEERRRKATDRQTDRQEREKADKSKKEK